MTPMKPVLDLVVDANVVFLLAFLLWATTQAALKRTRLRSDYAAQLKMLRMVLVLVILSPVLSFAFVTGFQYLWPKAPVTASDLAVAAYLRGEIGMSAVQFEELLNTRNHILEMVLRGQLPWLTGLMVALVLGSLGLFVQTLLTIFRVKRIVESGFVWRRTRTTDILLSDTVAVPFAARGLFRRHVVLPSSLIADPQKLRIVLQHEFEHLRRGDIEWEVAFELVRPLLYWNPVYLLWRRAFDQLRELSCDQAVIDKLRISPRAYAQAILSFLGPHERHRTVEVFNVAFVRTGGMRRALEGRFLALAAPRPERAGPGLFLAVALIFALTITVVAASVRNPSDWSHDRLMLSTVVNLERIRALGY